ncbi:MAG: hypothetical protein IME96_05995 [Proteobacteria bacterium]|nr:hypothetical protein [Pseudomonadota bacterium]
MCARAVGVAKPIVVIYVDPLRKESSEKLPGNDTVRPKRAKKIIERQRVNDGNEKKMKKKQKSWGMYLPHQVGAMIRFR